MELSPAARLLSCLAAFGIHQCSVGATYGTLTLSGKQWILHNWQDPLFLHLQFSLSCSLSLLMSLCRSIQVSQPEYETQRAFVQPATSHPAELINCMLTPAERVWRGHCRKKGEPLGFRFYVHSLSAVHNPGVRVDSCSSKGASRARAHAQLM